MQKEKVGGRSERVGKKIQIGPIVCFCNAMTQSAHYCACQWQEKCSESVLPETHQKLSFRGDELQREDKTRTLIYQSTAPAYSFDVLAVSLMGLLDEQTTSDQAQESCVLLYAAIVGVTVRAHALLSTKVCLSFWKMS